MLKKVGKALIIVLIGLVILGFLGYGYIRSKIYENNNISLENDIIKDKGVKKEDIINILLVGSDERQEEERSRSDSIIIATIDNKHENIKFTSILRDTYVSIPEHNDNKINAAYSFGGIDLLSKTISDNFGVHLNKYITINFNGFEDLIDSIGGITLDIKEYEINEINKFIGENREKKSPNLTVPGIQVLDGQQALAYARIRKVGNGSFERGERQRRVMKETLNKLVNLNAIEYPKVINGMLPYVKTNIPIIELLSYANDIKSFPSLIIKEKQVPDEETSIGGIYKNKGWVFLIDNEDVKKKLNEFIYEDRNIEEDEVENERIKKKIQEKYY